MNRTPAKSRARAGVRTGVRLKHITATVDAMLAASHQEYASAVQHPELGPPIRHDVAARSVGSEDTRSIADAVRYSVAATRVKVQHTYWTGTGRTQRTVKWVAPTLVADHDSDARLPGVVIDT